MKANYQVFINIMEEFRKLNISSMLPEISQGEFMILKMIEKCSRNTQCASCGIKISMLIKESKAPAPAISRTLRSLETKDLVKRTVDEADRRNTFVTLTEHGRRLIGEVDRIMEGFAEAVFGNLGDETMNKLNTYLRAFLEASKAEIEKRKYIGKKTGEKGEIE